VLIILFADFKRPLRKPGKQELSETDFPNNTHSSPQRQQGLATFFPSLALRAGSVGMLYGTFFGNTNLPVGYARL
jgi:hypothetical protein